ncbi:metal ABC transporter ATP-binding protein [Frankia sp. CcWB3]
MNPPVLAARGLTVRYGRVTAIEDVDVALAAGELVALVGRNGAGKSTLLRALAGLTPHEGTVTRQATACHHRRTELRGASEVRVAFVPQRATPRWDLPISVRQAVATGRLSPRRWWRRPAAADRRAIEAALLRMDLHSLADRPVGELSGGQAQRLLLARALAQEPDVLLLDEPCDGLDAASVSALLAALTELATGGIAVCCALHELHLARGLFDRAVVIDRAVLADGPAGQVLPVGAPLPVAAGRGAPT